MRSTSQLTRVLTAPNPGPLTLDGTNSYLIGTGDRVVVVDPGPLAPSHLAALASASVELILITHRHSDHTAGSAELHRLTGAPVRALDPDFCHGAPPLVDGEIVQAGGTSIHILATPGHTSDSACFHLPDDGSVLTGDTILGRGTTVIIPPDGSIADYLASLERLREIGAATVLPAHGPVLPDLAATCTAYLDHRLQRLDSIRAALDTLGPDASVQAVTDAVYTDIDGSVRFAAEQSVDAQLRYLRGLNG